MRDDELREIRHLLESLGDLDLSSRLAGVDSAPSEFASAYRAEVLTVRTVDGEDFRLFLKDYGSCRRPKDRPAQRRERERHVYRTVLAAADLGTAHYYGSVWDDERARFWLLIEFVDGLPLRYCEFDHWMSSAAWLAGLQSYADRHPEALCGTRLVVHDHNFFASTAASAGRASSAFPRDLRIRLGPVLARYTQAIGLMTQHTSTLVHGSYRPQNVIAVTEGGRVRICPTDWEEAGVGSPVYDLAYLADGFDPDRRSALVEAYRAEALLCGLHVPPADEMFRVLDCLALYKTLHTLGRTDKTGASRERIEELVGHAEASCALV